MLDHEMVQALRKVGGPKHKPRKAFLNNVALRIFFSRNFVDGVLGRLESDGESFARWHAAQQAHFGLAMSGKLTVLDILGREGKEKMDEDLPAIKEIVPLTVEQLFDTPGVNVAAAALVLDIFEALGYPLPSDPSYHPRDKTPRDVAHVLDAVGIKVAA